MSKIEEEMIMDVKRYDYILNNKSVYFYCDKECKQISDYFASLLEKEDKSVNILRDNAMVQLGWMFYLILGKKTGFQVVTLALETNPFKEIKEDLTLVLTIFKKAITDHTTNKGSNISLFFPRYDDYTKKCIA